MTKLWYIQDFGEAPENNAVWLNCKDIAARDNMEVGYVCYLDFQTGAGKSTMKVERLR